MQKNIGSKLALYPMPLLVIGTMVDGKPNWLLAGHSGIIGHDRVMVSLVKTHYTNKGIKDTKTLSINIVSEEMLKKADYVGSVSESKQDKSDVFEYRVGEAGAPIINNAPVVMECKVEDNYETDNFDNFIMTIANTYVQEENLDEKGIQEKDEKVTIKLMNTAKDDKTDVLTEVFKSKMILVGNLIESPITMHSPTSRFGNVSTSPTNESVNMVATADLSLSLVIFKLTILLH